MIFCVPHIFYNNNYLDLILCEFVDTIGTVAVAAAAVTRGNYRFVVVVVVGDVDNYTFVVVADFLDNEVCIVGLS